jgi:hypothetical protein
MSFNEDFTLIELEQIYNSGEYQDRLPAGPGAESGCDLNADLNNVLSAVRRIIHGADPSGVGNWYDAPSIGLSGLHQQVEQLQAISGMMAMPTWTNVFTWGSGILDLSQFDADVRISDGGTWFFNNGAGTDPIMEVTNSGVQIRGLGDRVVFKAPSKFDPGDTITFPKGSYTPGDPAEDDYPNLEVNIGGALWAPGSGVVDGDEQRRDYRESTPTSIVTNRRIRKGTRIDVRIYG